MQSGSSITRGFIANYGRSGSGWSNLILLFNDKSMQFTMKQPFFIDDGTRIASYRYYDGLYNNVYVGHKKGWGVAQTEISCNFTMPSYR
jgi:hypothetical protein